MNSTPASTEPASHGGDSAPLSRASGLKSTVTVAIKPTIRNRLITSFSLVILIPSLIISLVGILMIQSQVIQQAQNQVTSDLNSAREIYTNSLDRIRDAIRINATRRTLILFLSNGDTTNLSMEMERIRWAEHLDILTVTDASGRALYRVRNPAVRGDDQSRNPLLFQALHSGQPKEGTVIAPQEELARESEDLVKQAYMEFTPTPRARPTEATRETSGLMLMAAAPVYSYDGRLLGGLYGGVLLNRNDDIVDKIKLTVFKEGTYQGRELGTVTIFQNDVRISTNVKNADGSRAITTRVSAEVADEVLDRGRIWRGRAFVVNDWYLAAYKPIQDIEGKTIGMLYVGILERPFRDSLWHTLWIFLGIAFIGVALVTWVAIAIAERWSKPIRQMALAARSVTDGDYSQKVRVTSRDELGYLAECFNKMTSELARANREIEEWGASLEKKVAERTEEVKAMQAQLFQAEKLASIGKLAAGVAHEINNPLTGILTNSSLMLEDLPPEDPRREDVQTIVNETLRCRKIVKGLLDFARQTKPQKQFLDLNQVVRRVLSLIENQASFRNIAISTDLDPNPPAVLADQDQIQQVFLNIVLNASEAMPQQGQLRISSRTLPREGAMEVRFQDNGPGIPPDVQDKILEPFFTTKSTGTGLGLSIAYGIVERHRGTLKVESAPGKGTTIVITLPTESKEPEDG